MTNVTCKHVITVEIFTKKQWVICLNAWKTFHRVVWPWAELVLWRTEVCHKHWLRYLQLESKIIIRKKWIVPCQWNVTIWAWGDWLLRFAVMLLATWHKYHSILGSPSYNIKKVYWVSLYGTSARLSSLTMKMWLLILPSNQDNKFHPIKLIKSISHQLFAGSSWIF